MVVPPAQPRPVPRSTVAAQIEIPLIELDSLINRVVPQQLYHEEGKRVGGGLARATLDIDLQRNGDVYLRTREGRLISHIPLRAEGTVHKIGVSRPFETTFTVHAVTELSLDSTWATDARTYGGFTWQETPSIKLLGIPISLKGIAEKAIDRQLERLAPRIDSLIEERVNLRGRVENLWKELGEPIALREMPPVWIQVRPAEVFFVPAVSREDTLVYGLQVHAFAETIVGDAPALPDLGPLPPLRLLPDSLAQDTTAAFLVNLPVSMSYDDANALIAGAVGGRDLDVKDRVAVSLGEIELYPHHPFVVARVDFGAGLSGGGMGTQGRVFLRGTPLYDPATQTVRIDSFTYDMASEDALLRAADFMLRDTLLAQTRERLVLPVGDRLDSLHAQLQRALHDRPVGRHIVLDGTILDLTPGDLYLTADGLNVDVQARGQLTARVRSLANVKRRRQSEEE